MMERYEKGGCTLGQRKKQVVFLHLSAVLLLYDEQTLTAVVRCTFSFAGATFPGWTAEVCSMQAPVNQGNNGAAAACTKYSFALLAEQLRFPIRP